jgi:hypothetical protein
VTATATSTVLWVRWRSAGGTTKWHARTADYGLRCLPDDKQEHADEEHAEQRPGTADCCARCLKGDGVEVDQPEQRDGSRYGLRPWQRHKLLRELAIGERKAADLGREYGMSASAVRMFKMRHRAEVDAIAAAPADELAGLWIAGKSNRLAAYQHDYEQAASGEKANHHEWIKARTGILHNVAEETGQLPPRQQVSIMPVVHVIQGVDLGALT